MKKRKYIKMLMSLGYSRNMANASASFVARHPEIWDGFADKWVDISACASAGKLGPNRWCRERMLFYGRHLWEEV